jgi:hypothetical protein
MPPPYLCLLPSLIRLPLRSAVLRFGFCLLPFGLTPIRPRYLLACGYAPRRPSPPRRPFQPRPQGLPLRRLQRRTAPHRVPQPFLHRARLGHGQRPWHDPEQELGKFPSFAPSFGVGSREPWADGHSLTRWRTICTVWRSRRSGLWMEERNDAKGNPGSVRFVPAKLWNLSASDLAEIQRSLRELP